MIMPYVVSPILKAQSTDFFFQERLTAQEAMAHVYFDPVRADAQALSHNNVTLP